MRVIAGKARRIPLLTIDGMDTRPTTDRLKETLFNILQNYLADCVFMDLFSGSGAIGIEALSRGAAEAYFVENNPEAVRFIRTNLKKTGLEQGATVCQMDVLEGIRRAELEGRVFDVIFMDPPYRMEHEKHVLYALSHSRIVYSDTLIVVEAALDTSMDYAEEYGFEIVREKKYKTNKHLFLKKRTKQ